MFVHPITGLGKSSSNFQDTEAMTSFCWGKRKILNDEAIYTLKASCQRSRPEPKDRHALGFHHPHNADLWGNCFPSGQEACKTPLPDTDTRVHAHSHIHPSTFSLLSSVLTAIFKKAYKMYSILKAMTQNCNRDDSITSVNYYDNRLIMTVYKKSFNIFPWEWLTTH